MTQSSSKSRRFWFSLLLLVRSASSLLPQFSLESPSSQLTAKQVKLLEWCEGLGGSVTEAITIQGSGIGDGIGAFASEPASPGDVLFTVPSAACIKVSDALADPDIGKVCSDLVRQAEL